MKKFDLRNNRHIKNTVTSIFLIVVLAGYFLFFTSKSFLPYKQNLMETDIGKILQLEIGKNITLIRWDYSPDQHVMEIELLTENTTFDGADEYLYAAVDRQNQNLTANIIVADANMQVIHIENVPDNFSEISLRIKGTGDKDTNILRIYTNKDDVNIVDEIRPRTKPEYVIMRLENEIVLMEQRIESIENDNSELRDRIQNIEEANRNHELDKRYQTAEEIAQTNIRIRNNETEIGRLLTQIDANSKSIDEFENRISNIRERIDTQENG